MSKGKWYFAFTMKISSADIYGDPIRSEEKVEIELLAIDQADALEHANRQIQNIKSMDCQDLKRYSSIIGDENEIIFRDLHLIYREKLDQALIPAKWD